MSKAEDEDLVGGFKMAVLTVRVDEQVRKAGMGTNSAFICTWEIAGNLKSDFQRDFKEAGRVGPRVSCLVIFVDGFVRVVIFLVRLKMLLQRGDRRGGDFILDDSLQPVFNRLYEG